MSSYAAKVGGSPSSVAYATAKGGIHTLTKATAQELASDGILVNAVPLGRIDTPSREKFTPDKKREEGKQKILLGKEGKLEEVVGVVLFLASSYSDYVVGEIIEVTGGIF